MGSILLHDNLLWFFVSSKNFYEIILVALYKINLIKNTLVCHQISFFHVADLSAVALAKEEALPL